MNRSAFLTDPRQLLPRLLPGLTFEPDWQPPRILRQLGLWAPRRLAHAAITVPGFYLPTWGDALDDTQLAIDMTLETHKTALFTDTITPNYTTGTAYGVAPYDANETSGSGNWPAGGVALAGTVVDIASMAGSLVLDATDISVAGTNVTAAMGALLYADALAGNNAILLIDLVTALTTVNGLLEILFAAPADGGYAYIDFTPAA